MEGSAVFLVRYLIKSIWSTKISAEIYAIWAGRWKLFFGAKNYDYLGRTKLRVSKVGKADLALFFIVSVKGGKYVQPDYQRKYGINLLQQKI